MHKSITNLIEIEKKIYLNKLENNSDIKIIAVTKTFSIDKVLPLIDHGHLGLGKIKFKSN